MRTFDTNVQLIKYRVLKEVARLSFLDQLIEKRHTIPKTIIDTEKPISRCCVYKERAIIEERVGLALGEGNSDNVIEVINIACDECPVDKYRVSDACRGCLAHRCMQNCPRDAISIINHRAYIDQSKCIECGLCKKACPYDAIIESVRPCQKACHSNAIKIDDNRKAIIEDDKCTQCGACVYQCPFGAIVDKSSITSVIDSLKNKKINTYAVIAPSIVSQFSYAKIEQVVTGIKQLGFSDVIEVALGADITASKEVEEFTHVDKLFTSCCPAFYSYVENNYPDLFKYVSKTNSPMIEISKVIKKLDKCAEVVFIGPCTAKKQEIKRNNLKGITDFVITFEELQALLDSQSINVEDLKESSLNNGSIFGRKFAKSGGVTEAIKQGIKEQAIDKEFNNVVCSGLKECDLALKLLQKDVKDYNFIEGMACDGGCINGAGCISHGPKSKKEVDLYAANARESSIIDSIKGISQIVKI